METWPPNSARLTWGAYLSAWLLIGVQLMLLKFDWPMAQEIYLPSAWLNMAACLGYLCLWHFYPVLPPGCSEYGSPLLTSLKQPTEVNYTKSKWMAQGLPVSFMGEWGFEAGFSPFIGKQPQCIGSCCLSKKKRHSLFVIKYDGWK